MIRRLLSVIVLLPLIAVVVYWNVWAVALLVAGGLFVALVELYRVLENGGYQPRTTLGILCALLLYAAALLQAPPFLPAPAFDWTGLALALGLLLMLTGELFRREHENSLINWTLSFALACYLGWLLGHYLLLRRLDTPLQTGWLDFLQIPPGAAWVYLVLAITWMEDTTAYLVGRPFGRHKMAPLLSPAKSWEGAAGGFMGAVLIALLAVPVLGLPLSYGEAALLGAVGGIAGQVGDLCESLIKRQFGIKDFSNLIPGHGGVLDRLDSMLFTAPVLYYGILLLTGYF